MGFCFSSATCTSGRRLWGPTRYSQSLGAQHLEVDHTPHHRPRQLARQIPHRLLLALPLQQGRAKDYFIPQNVPFSQTRSSDLPYENENAAENHRKAKA